MESYEKIKKVLALGFMNFLDDNKSKGKMCLSNGECEDIEKAFNEQDWPRLAGYLDKYTESEDERIRKEIITLLQEIAEDDDFCGTEHCKEYIAYLEKQKDAFENGRQLGIMQEQARQELEGTDEKQKEPKPEWSEEDEKKIGRLRSVVNQLASYTDSLDVNGDYCEGDYAELDTWLKSLRPQPKAELSKEDELNTCPHYSDGYGCDISPMKKCESCEHRPSWKPSEEQMNHLCAVVDAAIRKHNESVSGYEPARVLKSLYEDLKKL